ncbi:MAG: hypothetical protein IJ295_02180, partial [Clostridia bacterium]|nr:hypothetical protein [Clostridia bacterium]
YDATTATWTQEPASFDKFGPFKIKDVVYSHNTMPSSADNQPTVSFAVDTSYMQTSTYRVMNFKGSTTRNFTINGYDISAGEGDDSMAGVQIVGTPNITTTKTYDGTTSVAVEWRGLVSVEGANGTLALANVVAAYDTANVGENKTITVSYVFTGSNAYLYSYNYSIENCVITPIIISEINGLTANKVYDGTTDATLITSGATYVGKLASDEISVVLKDGEKLTYAVADVGTNKQMNLSGSSLQLTGFHAGNYALASDLTLGIAGTVTAANLTAAATSYTGSYDAKAHNMITPVEVKLLNTTVAYQIDVNGVITTEISYAENADVFATQADIESIKWEYSLDKEIWESEIPTMTKAANVTVYFRVTANNHANYEGQVQFALSPLDINSVEISARLGQTEIVYDGQEHNVIPYVTANLDGEEINLIYGEDFRVDYINDYTEGEYDNGKGDTKNVGNIIIRIIGSGNSFVNVSTVQPQCEILPMIIDVPVEDTTNFHYNGSEQTYNIAPSDFYAVNGNIQTDVGTYDVVISLVDSHNLVWANGAVDDLVYQFIIYGGNVVVNWEWLHDYYYVGRSYTVDEALIATAK